MSNNYPKIHNSAWPGVVGKGPDSEEPFIGLDEMIALTAAAEVNGAKFDGILRAHMIMPNGTLRDTDVYSIIAPEWPTIKANLVWHIEKSR